MRSIFMCGFFVFFTLAVMAESPSGRARGLIISGQKGFLNIWTKDFEKYNIECSGSWDVSALNSSTDLSKYKYIIIDTSKITETFARTLEKWVKNGGILISCGIPSEYLPVSFSGESVPADSYYTAPWIDTDRTQKKKNAILRTNSVVDYGCGTLTYINIADDSELAPYAGTERSFTLNDKNIKCRGLTLVTGWPDRVLGDMSLVKAGINDKEKGISEQTVVSRYRYGRGLGIAYMLPPSGNEKALDIIRAMIIDYAVNFKASDKELSPYSVAAAPGKAADDKEKFKEPVPERPGPPANCILELQGDTFSGAKTGSPSWAPWRISFTGTPQSPIYRSFKINNDGKSLWMKVKAAYGDHTDAPVIEVKFNGYTLVKTVCPWARIQYNPKYYDSMFPVWIYVPADIIKEENTVSFIDHGPDWWLLDYVQFYKADGNESLASWQAKIRPGKYEMNAINGEIDLDGKLDENVWKDACWKNFEENESGAVPTSFAMINGKQNLFIAFKCPYDKKPKLSAGDNVVEFAAAWPGSTTSYIFSYRCNGETSLVSSDGDVISGSAHKGAFFDDREKKLITVEMAIPWTYLPIDSASQVYHPDIRRFIPGNGVMSINVFRKLQIGPQCTWMAWLPFLYQNERLTVLRREYLTRVPYRFMYENIENGKAFGLNAETLAVKWPSEFKWGKNTFSLESPAEKKEVQVRHNGQEVYYTTFSGRNIEIPLIHTGENDISIKSFDKDGNLTGLAMRPTEIDYPCMPMAGKSFYTTEKTAEIVLKIHDPGQFCAQVDRIDAELALPDGKLLRSSLEKTGIPREKCQRFPFDISKLEYGAYKVRMHLMAAGEIIQLPSAVIKKLAPSSSTEVKLRADGTPEINGKPFFPFGICMTAFEMHNSVKLVSEAGINMVIPWEDYSFMNKEKWDKFCDEAWKENIYIAIHPAIARNNAGKWLIDYDGMEKFVRSMKDYKSVIGYYPIDEPEYWHAPNCTPRKLKEFNDFLRKIDPYRPNMISHAVGNIHYGKSEGTVFNDVVDIRLWECYQSPKHIIERMDEMAETGKNDRVASWAFLRSGPGWAFKGINPRAFRANAYAAVIAGAKGIAYFELRTSRWTGHELWPDVFKKVSDEIQTLAASFMKNDSQSIDVEIEKGAKFSRAKAWVDGRDVYLMVVNANAEADLLKLKFPFAVSGNGSPLFEDMPDAIVLGNTVTVRMNPDGTGAYKLKKD